MSDSPPKLPRGLQARGKRFWTAIVTGNNEVTPGELELLIETARTLDSCERQERADPDGSGLRQSRALLARLLTALDLPESSIVSPVRARAKAANRARWAKPQDGAAVSEAATAAVMARWHGPRREPEPSGFMAEFLERRRKHVDQVYGRDPTAG